MFYDNKMCDGCSEIMLDGDDIVVCPECGTPQHRECYKKNNECVNAHLHAEGFDWQESHKEDAKAKENKVEQPTASEETSSEKEEPLNGANVFTSGEEIPNFPLPEFHVDGVYVNGQTFDADEDIGGATVMDIVTYTQVNSKSYLKRFVRNKHRKNFFISWNWGAFFFGPAWFFYRKLYKLGAIFLALAISATIATTPLLPAVEESVSKLEPMYEEFLSASKALSAEENEETLAEYNRTYSAVWAELKAILPKASLVLAATYLFSQIIPALFANYFYRQKMLDDIKFAKKATSDPKVLKYSLIRRGGVSFLAGLFASLASSHLPQIIMQIVSYLN